MENRQNIAVIGGGISGVGAAMLAKSKGHEVFLSEFKKISLSNKALLDSLQIPFEEGKHDLNRILKSELIVKSPGIPDTAEVIIKAKDNNIPIISEIELACRYTDAYIIGITGSNGKTTTTSLTYKILSDAGLNVGIAGNIGKSFAYEVMKSNYEYYVLELSSFQLDGIISFRPDISVIMNITPDHLDRYQNKFDKYVNSKFRITENQRNEDILIYNYDDEVIQQYISRHEIKAQKIPFSLKTSFSNGGYISNNQINISVKKKLFTMSIKDLGLKGSHNVYNSMAAGIVAKVLNLRKNEIKESLMHFKNLEHRLEFVSKIGGIEFINDSKATNVNSTWYALETMDRPVIWIAGGVDKGNDYSVLKSLVRKKVKAIICLGVDNRRIHEAFSREVDVIINTTHMREAVRMANHMADKGETILLSPSCASFDLFDNYEDRGNKFKNEVRAL